MEELTPGQEAWIAVFGSKPPLKQSPQFKTTFLNFRDVPFDELCNTMRMYGNREIWETCMRGKPVQIETGLMPAPNVDRCGGPYWNMTSESTRKMHPRAQPGVQYKCCQHMLEAD